MPGLYVQYGCGFSCPEGWLNFDSSPRLRFERVPGLGRLAALKWQPFAAEIRYGDILRGLPVADRTADGVYASHVLEHLSFEDCNAAIRKTFAMLRPGGIFRVIVPDLQVRAESYLAKLKSGDATAAHTFMTVSHLGIKRTSLAQDMQRALVHSNHLWMWDEASLTAALKQAGFNDVRRCDFNDSADPMFKRVENKERFFDSEFGLRELALEAIRPR